MINDMYQPVTLRNAVLAEHISVFESHIRKSASPHTADTYSRSLRCFLSFVIQDRKFKFRIKDFERYKTHLIETKKLQSPSISTYLTSLRRFSQYLVEVKVLPRNPAKHVHSQKNPISTIPSFFNLHELLMFFDTMDMQSMHGLRDKALFSFMLGSMLKEQELLSLTIADTQTLSMNSLIKLPETISEKQCEVKLPHFASEALSSYLLERFPEVMIQDAPLFHSLSNRSLGCRMSVRGLRDAFQKRMKKSGISPDRQKVLSPYSLRHTAGCIMALAGQDLEEIMQRMRIVSPSIAQRYLNLTHQAHEAGLHQALHMLEFVH